MIFTWIFYEAQKGRYLSPEVVFLDGTHIKANANIKRMKKVIHATARMYEKQLLEEINEDRKANGKKSFDSDSGNGSEKQKEMTVSTTDPESGIFHRGEHKRCLLWM